MTAAPVNSTSASLRRRHPAFGALWSAGAAYFIGNAMQTMAAAWMMVELTGSSFLAALVQTAVFLPMFLLSLPAGVLADTADRRRLLLWSLWVQAASGAVLAALLLAGVGGSGTLLFFIFLGGCCTALLTPAWNSAVADTVPRDELPQAITLRLDRLQRGARARPRARGRRLGAWRAARGTSCSRWPARWRWRR